MTDTPLIYTTLGNVPASSLDYKVTWVDNSEIKQEVRYIDGAMQVAADKEGSITMLEEYFDKETGECVKSSPHVYMFRGLDTASEQGALA